MFSYPKTLLTPKLFKPNFFLNSPPEKTLFFRGYLPCMAINECVTEICRHIIIYIPVTWIALLYGMWIVQSKLHYFQNIPFFDTNTRVLIFVTFILPLFGSHLFLCSYFKTRLWSPDVSKSHFLHYIFPKRKPFSRDSSPFMGKWMFHRNSHTP